MEPQLIYELIGYAGSALIIASIIQRSIFRLRVIGLAGSLAFLGYSLLIDAYPITVVNGIAASIHLYYLRELLLRPDETFSLLHVRPDSEYVRYFLDFHAKDIEGFFGGLPEETENLVMVFVLRDLVPAGLFIGVREGDRVETLMDYAIPQYRDLKIGEYLYARPDEVFGAKGVRTIVARSEAKVHADYLRKMGFAEASDGEFVLSLQQG